MTNPKTLLLCDCEGTMTLDADALARAVGAGKVRTSSTLCMDDLDKAAKALAGDGPVMIACGQQARLFADLAQEIAEETGAAADLQSVDIRDRAGWNDGADATAKQAALMAEGLMERPLTPVKDVESPGTCLVIGAGDVTLDAARRLSDTLAVTCLL
ncbi:MAG: (4Fe-4S)-binding protein, partial [Paracoccaceae bacterium]